MLDVCAIVATNMHMTFWIRFRCSSEEHEAFRREAKRHGLSLSAWFRMIARRKAGLS